MILPPPTYKTLASSYKVLSCPSPVNPHAHYSRGKHHSGLFSSMPKFSCFRISYKWNRIVCILFGKASFTLSLIVRFIRVLFICSSFFIFIFLLWESGQAPGRKSHNILETSIWLGHHVVFSSQSCLHWASRNLAIIVHVFLTHHWFIRRFLLVWDSVPVSCDEL